MKVKDLSVSYRTFKGDVTAVQDFSMTLEKGESLGLVGESGCGKTTVMKSLIRLLSDNGFISGGEVLVDGKDLVPMSYEELREVRWRKIALINQAAMNAFNPVYTIGDQICEVITVQGGMTKKDALV